MSDEILSVVLPLFEANALTSAALDDKEIENYGAVVSREGNRYTLHRVADFHDEPAVKRFMDLQGQSLEVLTTKIASDAGLDLFNPSADAVMKVCQALNTNMVIAQVVQTGSGYQMVSAFANPSFRFNLVRRKYICSYGSEAYDESVFQRNNGQCPVHTGATLN